MSEYLSVFKNNSYQEKVYKAYDEIMAIWPVPFDELFISTGFGETHIIACGCEKSPPLILFHALYASAASWYKNVEGLSKKFRVYCVDIIGDPNKSRPIKHIRQLNDFVDWISALLDGLQVKQAFFVGNSVGAFHAVNYAIKVPERVISMVLIGPAATFRQIMPFYINTFPGAITSWSL
jgi:pimeloyl-ACP methyl ester carboxylesterase